MREAEAHAPGKIILAGEHAVVYGQPALAVPVHSVRARARVRLAAQGQWLDAAQVQVQGPWTDLSPGHPLRVAIEVVLDHLGIANPPPFYLELRSDIPVAAGMGSSAATAVAMIRALAQFLGHPLPREDVNRLAYEVEKVQHGTPSGIDNTVVTYEQPLLYRRGEGGRLLPVARPVTLVIADSGERASTREMVARVRAGWQQDPARYEALFRAVGEQVERARAALAQGALEPLAAALRENQRLLAAMGVSTPTLERLIALAERAGAWAAKLSGAGGGGNILALVPDDATARRVAEALAPEAARVIITTVPVTAAGAAP